jgi:serine/threonine kinase 38
MNVQEAKFARKMQLEKKMSGLPEEKKKEIRQNLEHQEVQISKETRKKVTTADFENLGIIGRGAFGEVRLVRRKSTNKNGDNGDNKIYALKSMKKEMMVVKNQVGHVKAERDVLATADENNKWLTVLHYSFTDETHLYMVMEYLAGGDLMSLLMKEDTFSEEITKFFMAEAAHAISSVHAVSLMECDVQCCVEHYFLCGVIFNFSPCHPSLLPIPSFSSDTFIETSNLITCCWMRKDISS